MSGFKVEIAQIDSLKPHPRNYRQHPEDQLAHLVESIREHGVYRNVVVANDSTLLAGHGVVLAARQIGLKEIPVIRLDVGPEDVRAIKVLVGDNEIEHLGEQDDRLLADLLKQIRDVDIEKLLGTGFDDAMLANFIMVTRPRSEINDLNAAAQWVGMPSYEEGGGDQFRLVVSFPDEAKREEFCTLHDLRVDKKQTIAWSTRWPWTDREDKASVRFEDQP